MPRVGVWIVAPLLMSLAGCLGPGTPGPAGLPTIYPSSGPTPSRPTGGLPTGLDGSVVYTLASATGSGGSTTTMNRQLSVTVHLAAAPDEPSTFGDAGSTFEYTETSSADDPQTASSCGLHRQSSGSGSGSFEPKGQITASYGDNSPEVDLTIHAPYSDQFSQIFPCNGMTSSDSSDEVTDSVECKSGGTGWLAGIIEPGNVMRVAAGQVIDFTCKEALAIGTGAITVTGKLTSR